MGSNFNHLRKVEMLNVENFQASIKAVIYSNPEQMAHVCLKELNKLGSK